MVNINLTLPKPNTESTNTKIFSTIYYAESVIVDKDIVPPIFKTMAPCMAFATVQQVGNSLCTILKESMRTLNNTNLYRCAVSINIVFFMSGLQVWLIFTTLLRYNPKNRLIIPMRHG